MGDIGLIIGLGLDPADASAGVEQFGGDLRTLGPAGKVSLEAIAEASQPVERSLLNQHQSVHLLAEEMGIHLPRAVVSGISEMMPAISALGPALLGAFAVREIPRLVDGIREMTDDMAGYDKAAKKAFQDAVAASDDALTHFKSIKEGIKLEADINRNIAALSVQRDVLDSTGGVAVNYAQAVAQFFAGNYAAAAAHVAMARTEKLDMTELAKLEAQRAEQLNSRKDLEIEAHKETKRADSDAAEALRHQLEMEKQVHEWRAKAVAEAGKQLAEDAKAQRSADMTRESDLKAQLMLLQDISFSGAVSHAQLVQYVSQIQAQTVASKQLSAAHLELNQVLGVGKGIMKEFGEATAQSTLATMVQGLAAGESFARVAKAAIRSIAEQAGIQAVWEAVQGFAMLALSFFIPDPRYTASADAHFTAAAIFGGISGAAAGASAAIHVPRGAGAAGGGYGSPDTGRGSGDSGYQPSTLAPGAAGSGGRFNGLNVTIIAEHEAGQWMASTLNAAVNRGVTLTATNSQRGAPVGH